MVEPGPLIAEGRDNLIYDAGPGRILRVSRTGKSLEAEARVIAFARESGLPVPEVYEATADRIEMERVAGPNMLEAMAARPWSLPRHARTLADLHGAVHAVAAPAWLASASTGAGPTLVHLDLHPLNVVVTSEGPVLIDWTNAGAGRPEDDVAMTWLLLAAGGVDGSLSQRALAAVARRLLLRRFLAAAGRPPAEALRTVVNVKAADPHMTAREVATMRALAELA
ncbi:MAG TPA: phosphotransferase [Acidimicrobiales bacterium]|nr:phosphotransferase [Acidimicrobiales bacterium]